jgi:RNA polymerase sigma-70 factor, ECF subfamily
MGIGMEQGEARSAARADDADISFEEFYVREYAAVVGLAFALSGSRSGAEDLAQDAFLAAHRGWSRIAAYDKPDAWVRHVVANLAVSTFRRRTAEAKALARLTFGSRVTIPELSEDDAAFWSAVRSLPRRQSQVIALHYLEDRSVLEVAAILGIAEGTVKKHLHDGRSALARRLGATSEEDR